MQTKVFVSVAVGTIAGRSFAATSNAVGKHVLTLVDQTGAKKNVDNLVEITGSVDSVKRTLRADSIIFIDQARPMGEVAGKESSSNP